MLKYVLPLCVLASASVMADDFNPSIVSSDGSQEQNQLSVDAAMSSLQTETIRANEFDYVLVTDDSVTTQFDTYLDSIYRQTYITQEEAKEMDLKPGYSFHVYDFDSVQDLEKKIAERINQDKPIYFTVDYYQHPVNQSERTEYTAKVTLY
ncbi:DUF2536 family protein [Vibrio mediterranei]|uniref:DUF2536 family protein n=1 Tax=Vibrio mediterranei TaxID=689 RepID=UPI00148CCC16|nr:DUF2536 family protein [Vibrio mediterranei]MCG9627963.1 DUF2536 family protein [Vibrio mediterranei]NOI25806.1 DUF2536 family protein [Vibrio mediterranei]